VVRHLGNLGKGRGRLTRRKLLESVRASLSRQQTRKQRDTRKTCRWP
jgi:hypothetical protein